MLQGGYFIGLGNGAGSSSSDGNSSNIHVDSEGNIVYNPADPFFIDEDNRVFFSDEEKNGVIYLEDGKLFVEKVV